MARFIGATIELTDNDTWDVLEGCTIHVGGKVYALDVLLEDVRPHTLDRAVVGLCVGECSHEDEAFCQPAKEDPCTE